MRIYLAIGATERGRLELLKQEGVKRVLFSYADLRGSRYDVSKGTLGALFSRFSDVMLDSGAFSAARSGAVITVENYSFWLRYVADLGPVSHYIVLDDLSSPDITRRSQEYMEGEGLKPLPVYHYGEPTGVLDDYCSRYPLVCIGGMAIGRMHTDDLRVFWEAIRERYPKDNDFHLLGTNQFRAFEKHQPYSVDSTSWLGDIWGNLLAFDHDGLPSWTALRIAKSDGVHHFFTPTELRAHNIRALLAVEALDWERGLREKKGVRRSKYVHKGRSGRLQERLW